MLVHEILDNSRDPGAQAVRDADGSWTYAELVAASHACARWLRQLGVDAGDRVMMQAVPTRLVAVLVYACSRLGAILVPIDPATRPYQLRQIAEDAEPTVLIWGDVSASWAGGRITHVSPAAAWHAVCAGLAPYFSSDGVEPTRPLVLFYTSGSTGRPKAVVCPHAQIVFAASAIAGRLRYRPTDVVFCRIPLSFDYGLYQIFLAGLASATLVLANPHADARLLADIVRHHATVVPLVPALATMLLRLAGRAAPPTAIRLFTNTGEKLPGSAIRDLRRWFPGVAVQLMFGLTECKRISILQADGDLTRPNSLGTPLPGTTVSIHDDEGRPAEPGVVGEIVVTGPHVMAGYWRDPELTRRVFRKDPTTGVVRLMTGDRGYLDADGHLYFSGRRDLVFKRRGFRTSAEEIEAAALDIPAVAEAIVLPPRDNSDAVIYVVAPLTPVQVIRALRERLAPAKVPDRCQVLERLPRGSNGKIDRAALARTEVTDVHR